MSSGVSLVEWKHRCKHQQHASNVVAELRRRRCGAGAHLRLSAPLCRPLCAGSWLLIAVMSSSGGAGTRRARRPKGSGVGGLRRLGIGFRDWKRDYLLTVRAPARSSSRSSGREGAPCARCLASP